jgi:hypothetical protein
VPRACHEAHIHQPDGRLSVSDDRRDAVMISEQVQDRIWSTQDTRNTSANPAHTQTQRNEPLGMSALLQGSCPDETRYDPSEISNIHLRARGEQKYTSLYLDTGRETPEQASQGDMDMNVGKILQCANRLRDVCEAIGKMQTTKCMYKMDQLGLDSLELLRKRLHETNWLSGDEASTVLVAALVWEEELQWLDAGIQQVQTRGILQEEACQRAIECARELQTELSRERHSPDSHAQCEERAFVHGGNMPQRIDAKFDDDTNWLQKRDADNTRMHGRVTAHSRQAPASRYDQALAEVQKTIAMIQDKLISLKHTCTHDALQIFSDDKLSRFHRMIHELRSLTGSSAYGDQCGNGSKDAGRETLARSAGGKGSSISAPVLIEFITQNAGSCSALIESWKQYVLIDAHATSTVSELHKLAREYKFLAGKIGFLCTHSASSSFQRCMKAFDMALAHMPDARTQHMAAHGPDAIQEDQNQPKSESSILSVQQGTHAINSDANTHTSGSSSAHTNHPAVPPAQRNTHTRLVKSMKETTHRVLRLEKMVKYTHEVTWFGQEDVYAANLVEYVWLEILTGALSMHNSASDWWSVLRQSVAEVLHQVRDAEQVVLGGNFDQYKRSQVRPCVHGGGSRNEGAHAVHHAEGGDHAECQACSKLASECCSHIKHMSERLLAIHGVCVHSIRAATLQVSASTSTSGPGPRAHNHDGGIAGSTRDIHGNNQGEVVHAIGMVGSKSESEFISVHRLKHALHVKQRQSFSTVLNLTPSGYHHSTTGGTYSSGPGGGAFPGESATQSYGLSSESESDNNQSDRKVRANVLAGMSADFDVLVPLLKEERKRRRDVMSSVDQLSVCVWACVEGVGVLEECMQCATETQARDSYPVSFVFYVLWCTCIDVRGDVHVCKCIMHAMSETCVYVSQN